MSTLESNVKLDCKSKRPILSTIILTLGCGLFIFILFI
jgi:hypothetical protein